MSATGRIHSVFASPAHSSDHFLHVREPIVKFGVLLKRTMLSGWQQRQLYLSKDQLMWFKPPRISPLGALDLQAVEWSRVSPTASEELTISIANRSKVLRFRARGANEAKSWAIALAHNRRLDAQKRSKSAFVSTPRRSGKFWKVCAKDEQKYRQMRSATHVTSESLLPAMRPAGKRASSPHVDTKGVKYRDSSRKSERALHHREQRDPWQRPLDLPGGAAAAELAGDHGNPLLVRRLHACCEFHYEGRILQGVGRGGGVVRFQCARFAGFGRVGRKACQDRVAVCRVTAMGKEMHLFLLADGHGPNSEIIAEYVATAIPKQFPAFLVRHLKFSTALEHCFQSVHVDLVKRFGCAKMAGTTCTVAVLDLTEKLLQIGHVGDSGAAITIARDRARATGGAARAIYRYLNRDFGITVSREHSITRVTDALRASRMPHLTGSRLIGVNRRTIDASVDTQQLIQILASEPFPVDLVFRCPDLAFSARSVTRAHDYDDADEAVRARRAGGIVQAENPARCGEIDASERRQRQGGLFCRPMRLWDRAGRVPGLQVSRSLGDMHAHGVGNTAKPECVTIRVTRQHRHLIIASDGLWNMMTPDDVSAILTHTQADSETATRSCDFVVREAASRWLRATGGARCDDISVIVVYLGDAASEPRPPRQARPPVRAAASQRELGRPETVS